VQAPRLVRSLYGPVGPAPRNIFRKFSEFMIRSSAGFRIGNRTKSSFNPQPQARTEHLTRSRRRGPYKPNAARSISQHASQSPCPTRFSAVPAGQVVLACGCGLNDSNLQTPHPIPRSQS
jgi:hypothetical protein